MLRIQNNILYNITIMVSIPSILEGPKFDRGGDIGKLPSNLKKNNDLPIAYGFDNYVSFLPLIDGFTSGYLYIIKKMYLSFSQKKVIAIFLYISNMCNFIKLYETLE